MKVLESSLAHHKISVGIIVLLLFILGGAYVYDTYYHKENMFTESFTYHMPTENANAAMIALLTMILAAILANIYLMYGRAKQ
uniref:Uncharacterized protein n=1 Tax=viral metagenome TaxID=1070528 RepID=A0A6C0I3I0_9ZZZZ